jgi:hypothetical protein
MTMIFVPSYLTHRKLDSESAITCVPYCSARGGHFSSGLAGYIIGHFQQFLKNTCSEFQQLEFWQWILLCVFLQLKKDKGRFRYVGSDHSLVSRYSNLLVRFPVGSKRSFSCPQHPDRVLRVTQPHTQWVLKALSPGLNRPVWPQIT